MKTKVSFICMMLFWVVTSDLPADVADQHKLDLPAGARARLDKKYRCRNILFVTSSDPFNEMQVPVYYLWDFAYSPDGKVLAVAGEDIEDIWFYDAETAEKLQDGAAYLQSRSVVFHPDGHTLLAGAAMGHIDLVNPASPYYTAGRLLGVELPYAPIAWLSPDRSTLAWEEERRSFTNHYHMLHLSDLRGGSRRTIFGHEKELKDHLAFPFILSVGFDEYMRTLATASEDGIIHLWDANDGSHLQKFTQYSFAGVFNEEEPPEDGCEPGTFVEISGKRYYWKKDVIIEVGVDPPDYYDDINLSPSPREYWRSLDPNYLDDLPAPKRHVLLSLSDHWFWPPKIGQKAFQIDSRHFYDFPLDSVENPANIIHLYETTYDPNPEVDACGKYYLLDKANFLKHTFKGHTGCVWNVVYGEDGREVASASVDGSIRTWDVETGAQRKKFTSHTLHFSNIAFSPDRKMIAVGYMDGSIQLWRNNEVWTVFKAHDGPVTSVAFHPWWEPFKVPVGDEVVENPVTPTLASAGTDGTVRLWRLNLASKQVRPRSNAWVFYVKPLGSEDEDFERVSILWDPVINVGDLATSVAFSPNGMTLAMGSWNGVKVLKLWTPEQGSPPLIRYSDPVMSVAFSPESRTLAAGYLNGTIRLGRVGPGGRSGTLRGHTESVFKVMFSPDGKTLASGSDDGTVLLWNHEPAPKDSFFSFHPPTSDDANGDADDASAQEDTPTPEDVDGDGEVTLNDLIFVNANLGKTGENAADVNQDGVVDIKDMLLVADALAAAAAAPAAGSRDLELPLTRTQVAQWLAQVHRLNPTECTSQRGIRFLEQLLAVLTPQETFLLANYPNPFNPETWIPYQLAEPADVTVRIYAMDGSLVRTLALGHQSPGIYQSRGHAAYWDGKNELGEPVASGPYFCTLTAGEFRATRKLLIQK